MIFEKHYTRFGYKLCLRFNIRFIMASKSASRDRVDYKILNHFYAQRSFNSAQAKIEKYQNNNGWLHFKIANIMAHTNLCIFRSYIVRVWNRNECGAVHSLQVLHSIIFIWVSNSLAWLLKIPYTICVVNTYICVYRLGCLRTGCGSIYCLGRVLSCNCKRVQRTCADYVHAA